MLKVCQKKNCYNASIHRGKYCENHRTNKSKIKPINNILIEEEKKEELLPYNINNYNEDINLALKLSLETLKDERDHIINNKKIKEDRELRIEQEYEFNEAMRMDKEKIENKRRLIEEIEIKRINTEKNETGDSDEYFNIKIKLSNTSLIRKFKVNSNIKDIRDYLDVYFQDNNINIRNYNLVINQSPIRKLLIDDNDISISSLKLSHSFILFLENLDS
jgi:hypothetical protein